MCWINVLDECVMCWTEWRENNGLQWVGRTMGWTEEMCWRNVLDECVMCWTEWREKNLLNQHLAALGLSRKNNDKEAYVEEVLSSIELENCLENQT